jgi:hypothetical protein
MNFSELKIEMQKALDEVSEHEGWTSTATYLRLRFCIER